MQLSPEEMMNPDLLRYKQQQQLLLRQCQETGYYPREDSSSLAVVAPPAGQKDLLLWVQAEGLQAKVPAAGAVAAVMPAALQPEEPLTGGWTLKA